MTSGDDILKYLLALILLGAILVLMALVTSRLFGFSFGVRVADNMHVFWELSRMELMTVTGITIIVAFVSVVLLKKLRGGQALHKKCGKRLNAFGVNQFPNLENGG